MAATSIRRRKVHKDGQYYVKAYLCYLAHNDYGISLQRWCQSVFLQNIVPKLIGGVDVPEGGELRTLGVGSGAGEMECHILRPLLQNFLRISNHVIEPFEDLLSNYKAYVSVNSKDLQGISFNWNLQTLQEYRAKREIDGIQTKFHVISAMNSLYYVDDLGHWLDYLYDLLENGGILLMIMTEEMTGQAHLNRNFLQQPQWNDSDEVTDNAETQDCTGSSIDLAATHFTTRGIYHEQFVLPMRTDVTECFSANPTSEAHLLLDFLSNVINFRRSVASDIYGRFLKVLGSDKCSERKDGRVLLLEDQAVIAAFKNDL